MKLYRLLLIVLSLLCIPLYGEVRNSASYAVKNTGERNLRLEIWEMRPKQDTTGIFYSYEIIKYKVTTSNVMTQYAQELTVDTIRTIDNPAEHIFETYSFVDLPFELGDNETSMGNITRRKSKDGQITSVTPVFFSTKKKGNMATTIHTEYLEDGGKEVTTETYLAETHYFPHARVVDIYDKEGSFRKRTIWEKLN